MGRGWRREADCAVVWLVVKGGGGEVRRVELIFRGEVCACASATAGDVWEMTE